MRKYQNMRGRFGFQGLVWVSGVSSKSLMLVWGVWVSLGSLGLVWVSGASLGSLG